MIVTSFEIWKQRASEDLLKEADLFAMQQTIPLVSAYATLPLENNLGEELKMRSFRSETLADILQEFETEAPVMLHLISRIENVDPSGDVHGDYVVRCRMGDWG